MYNLTKTTEHTKYTQARVLGYYYRTPLTIGHRSLSGSPPLRGRLVDTFVLRGITCTTHEHVRRGIRAFQAFCQRLWKEQANGLSAVPTSATTLYVHYSTCVDTMQQNEKLCEAVQRRFHPVQ